MMLKCHMDACESHLLAVSEIPGNSGHSLHKGTPRETFIREFLQRHLPANISIGSGEIIDSNSRPGEKRNQYDIVIFKNSYSKLDFGGGINGFLAESVIATIEVKSTLTSADLEQAVIAAGNSKKLERNTQVFMSNGYSAPKILNYVIAYSGPASMRTVCDWIPKIHERLGVTVPAIPLDTPQRIATPSPSIDGIFVLGKGFVYFDNVEYGFLNDYARRVRPGIKWCFSDVERGSLLLFFTFLQTAVSNLDAETINFLPYIAGWNVKLGVV